MTQHAAAAAVVFVVNELAQTGRRMTASELADRIGAQRDTLRRICSELTQHGWLVEWTELGQTTWSLGPALPELGLAEIQRVHDKMATLQTSAQAMTRPHAWQRGVDGQWRWLPVEVAREA